MRIIAIDTSFFSLSPLARDWLPLRQETPPHEKSHRSKRAGMNPIILLLVLLLLFGGGGFYFGGPTIGGGGIGLILLIAVIVYFVGGSRAKN